MSYLYVIALSSISIEEPLSLPGGVVHFVHYVLPLLAPPRGDISLASSIVTFLSPPGAVVSSVYSIIHLIIFSGVLNYLQGMPALFGCQSSNLFDFKM